MATMASSGSDQRPPLPNTTDAFMRLVEAGWDAEVARRPHGQHTTVVVHLDVKDKAAQLHLGPLLTDAERRYLTCDATCEAWFERDGQPIGAGRATRLINRRLRRALEHRHPTCGVPGCGATRGLHAHHIQHWEDGGPTELDNLVLLCPYHHRLHHRGVITITGPAHRLNVTDSAGKVLSAQSLARPPTQPPPAVAPCPGPTGERADWWWYEPFQPQPPPTQQLGASTGHVTKDQGWRLHPLLNQNEFGELVRAFQRCEMSCAVGGMKPHIGEVVLQPIRPRDWEQRIMLRPKHIRGHVDLDGPRRAAARSATAPPCLRRRGTRRSMR